MSDVPTSYEGDAIRLAQRTCDHLVDASESGYPANRYARTLSQRIGKHTIDSMVDAIDHKARIQRLEEQLAKCGRGMRTFKTGLRAIFRIT
jgi:hypothetical protein